MYSHCLQFEAEVLLFVLKSILAQDLPPFVALLAQKGVKQTETY